MELERIHPNHLAVVGVAFAGFVATTLDPGPWVPGDMLMGFGLGAILPGYGGKPIKIRLTATGHAILLGLCGLQIVRWIGELIWGYEVL